MGRVGFGCIPGRAGRHQVARYPAAWLLAALLVLIGPLIAPGLAAAPTITEYSRPIGSYPRGIVAGPDGALWVAESGGNRIVRITTGGTVTEYPLPAANSYAQGIAVGPDGALWFAEANRDQIGRITTAGAITEYPLPSAGSGPYGIVAGPDGALWFTEYRQDRIGRITTGGAITEYPLPAAGSGPNDIAAGPDGALWFTEFKSNRIGRITTTGAITEYSVPTPNGNPVDIAAGPDGALWFTESGANRIGRITTAGAITEYPLPSAGSGPWGITVGPDDALWFAEVFGNRIGRITTAGAITEYPLPSPYSYPHTIVPGPDGALWFTEESGNRIGRLQPDGAPGPSPSPSPSASPSPSPSASPSRSPSPTPSPGPAIAFEDVPPGYWAHDQIYTFARRGITTGCDTDSQGRRYYCPERPVTRAEMAAFLIRTLTGTTAAPAGPATPTFSDVPANHPQYGYIEALVARGITTGCGGTEYCPDREVTRAEMAAFIIRALTNQTAAPPGPDSATFPDVPPGHPQYGFVEAMAARKITTGCGDPSTSPRTYCPNDNVTRAEMAVFIVRAYP